MTEVANRSIVVTLFENAYHYGVAALVNSLFRRGFRGKVYVGYRGCLPSWVGNEACVDGVTSYVPVRGIEMHFIHLDVRGHLTNYKPRFMLDIWQKYGEDNGSIFYFDPDIIVRCRWSFFEEWVYAGVAVCEDVNGSMSVNHPIRFAWQKLLIERNLPVVNNRCSYVNAGFIGMRSNDVHFLSEWSELIKIAELSGANLDLLTSRDRTNPFSTPDQDALNIGLMATTAPISEMGPDGMGFQRGGGNYVMLHAIGPHKPWNNCYTFSAIRGRRMNAASRYFLRHLDGPIVPCSRLWVAMKTADANFSRLVSRLF